MRVCTKKTTDNGKIGLGVVAVSRGILCQAHRYILNNTDKVQYYINDHMDNIRRTNLTKSRRKKMGNR